MPRLQRRTSSAVVRITLSAACATVALIAGAQQIAIAEPTYSHGSGHSHARDAYGPEQRASELYVDGLEKLEAGHRDFARSTFESVLARYPDTPAAESARRALEGPVLNAHQPQGERPQHHADAGGTLPTAVTAPESTGSLASPEQGPAPAAIDPGFHRSPTWDLEVRRNASIQAKLRVEAGDRIFFAPGSAELGSRARVALAAQAQWLIRWREFETAIEGHADEPGTEEENISLSVQRAEAVRQRLIAEGVEPGRIAIVPMGRAVRLATCADVDCRAQNRRAVTLVFVGGTHHRLGLVTGAPRSAEPDPKVSASFPQTAPDGAGLARPVGVAR